MSSRFAIWIAWLMRGLRIGQRVARSIAAVSGSYALAGQSVTLSLPPSGGFDYYIGPSGSDSNPGTFGSPWAITAINSKGATYAGKTVGLLDGTYDISGISVVGGRQVPVLAVASGSSGSQTIIKAVNARAAILQCKTGGGTRQDHPAIGQETSTGGYVTIDGLTIYGTSYCGVGFNYSGNLQPGIIVKNCEIYDIDRQSIDTDNTPGVWLSGADGALIYNNYIHNCKCSGNGHNGAGVLVFGSRATRVWQNTIQDCGSGVYDKHDASHSIPNKGAIIEYNYIKDCAAVFTGFDNAGFTGVYDTFYIRFNVIELTSSQTGITFPDLGPTYHYQSPVQVYNNTVVVAAISHGVWQLSANTTGATLKFYNNIMDRTGSTGYLGDIHIQNFGEVLGLDFNCWGTSGTLSFQTGSGESTSTTDTTVANWRTRLGSGTNTHEANSTSTRATFVGTGTGPVRFKVASGSAFGTGKVGGIDAGSAVNMGAYALGAEQIGKDW